ncbi:hypothetical protein GAU_2262 [Gemmatimonas aurantiaca T-27]|uniref:Uncharacterized protein n=2 Tax=Gemmatimonas aurantiaca TaxID=173480 RepID=C1AAP8_GEMAT|nr:hypothetical protein GAU_2262 [Gemmatimonas aurantiaca T-27]
MFTVGPMSWLFQPPPTGSAITPRPPAPRRIETMLWINDCPLERLGFVLQRPQGWLDDVTRVLPETLRIQGLTGGQYQELAPAPALDIVLEGALIDVSIDQLQMQLAMLRDWLSGLLELRWPHAPQSVRRGRAGPVTVRALKETSAFVSPDRQAWLVSVTIRCADAVAYHRHPRRVRLSTTPRPIMVGGLSVGGVITLVGPLSGEVRLILESPTGVRLAQLALVIPGPEALVDAQDTATIRMDAPNTIVRRNGSGEETNVYHWRPLALNSGWWKVSPEHADRWNGQYPRARLSTGSGWWRYHLAEAA